MVWFLRLALALTLTLSAGFAWAASPIVWVPETNTVARFFNSAVDALNRGDPARAEVRARKTLEQQETYGEAHLVLGMALSRQGKVDDALGVLLALDQRAPGRATILTEIAMVWFAKEDFERAGAYAMDAVSRNPDELAGWQAITLVRGRTGEHTLLGDELDAEEARNPRPAIACFQVHRWIGAGDLSKAALALHTCETAERRAFVDNAGAALAAAGGDVDEGGLRGAGALMSAAAEAFNAGQFARAERLAGRALDVGALPVRALLIRAEALYKQDKFDEARRDLEQMLGDGGSWVTVSGSGSLDGVLTKEAEEDTILRMRRAAAMLVVLHARAGDHVSARRALLDAREALGDIAPLRAAEIESLHVRGEDGKAWAALQQALVSGDDPRALTVAATKLAYEAAALADDAQVGRVVASGTPVLVVNLAAGAYNANLVSRCLAAAESLLTPAPDRVSTLPAHADELATVQANALALAFRCAVAGEDLDRAHSLGKRGTWRDPLDPDVVWAHAVRLYSAERYQDTLDVLSGSEARSVGGRTGAEARELGISAQLGLGQLDEALAAALQESAPLVARQRTAAALASAGRVSDASRLLALVCPELPAKEKARCEAQWDALEPD